VTRVFLFELIPDTRRNKCNLQNWSGLSMFFGKPDGRWSLHEGTAQGALAVHLRTGAVSGAVHEKAKLSSKGASR
jgi:hypothetical protein